LASSFRQEKGKKRDEKQKTKIEKVFKEFEAMSLRPLLLFSRARCVARLGQG
jgi:hypothetical protein